VQRQTRQQSYGLFNASTWAQTKWVRSAFDATSLVIKEPEVVLHKTDEPDVLGDFTDADVLELCRALGRICNGRPASVVVNGLRDNNIRFSWPA
jgi:hypothetical protein